MYTIGKLLFLFKALSNSSQGILLLVHVFGNLGRLLLTEKTSAGSLPDWKFTDPAAGASTRVAKNVGPTAKSGGQCIIPYYLSQEKN
jgi:hypothetical protein